MVYYDAPAPRFIPRAYGDWFMAATTKNWNNDWYNDWYAI